MSGQVQFCMCCGVDRISCGYKEKNIFKLSSNIQMKFATFNKGNDILLGIIDDNCMVLNCFATWVIK